MADRGPPNQNNYAFDLAVCGLSSVVVMSALIYGVARLPPPSMYIELPNI